VTTHAGDAVAGALPGPGMLASHYAPLTPLRLVGRDGLGAVVGSGARVVVLAPTGTDVGGHTLIAMPTDAEAFAARLYAALREADAAGAEVIAVVRPDDDGDPLWVAIRDRLVRAATS